jgi:hypothetical protein
LSLNSGPYTCLAGSLPLEPLHKSFFCVGCFRDRISTTVCPGWLQMAILLISASWVASIIGISMAPGQEGIFSRLPLFLLTMGNMACSPCAWHILSIWHPVTHLVLTTLWGSFHYCHPIL